MRQNTFHISRTIPSTDYYYFSFCMWQTTQRYRIHIDNFFCPFCRSFACAPCHFSIRLDDTHTIPFQSSEWCNVCCMCAGMDEMREGFRNQVSIDVGRTWTHGSRNRRKKEKKKTKNWLQKNFSNFESPHRYSSSIPLFFSFFLFLSLFHFVRSAVVLLLHETSARS